MVLAVSYHKISIHIGANIEYVHVDCCVQYSALNVYS